MNKKRFSIKEIFNLRNLIILLVSLLIETLIVILYGTYTDFTLYNLINGFFIAGAVLVFLGLMVLVLNQGTFDIIAVGFSNLFYSLKEGNAHKYDGVYGYQEIKKDKRYQVRFSFLSYCFAGIIFLLIAIILYFVWKSSI